LHLLSFGRADRAGLGDDGTVEGGRGVGRYTRPAAP
jgi:hypothetical protein